MTEVVSLPYFPELSGQKTSRVITKHFTNAAMYMPKDQFCMLTWLIYQSKADNTVNYSTQLLIRYSAAIKASTQLYNSTNNLNTGIKHLRVVFKTLIQNGYLLPNYNKKLFTINPMLSYRAEYMRVDKYRIACADYKEICRYYSFVDPPQYEYHIIREFTANYSNIVDSYMSKKKLVK